MKTAYHLVILSSCHPPTRILVHKLSQPSNIINRRLGQDAVAQVEDMTGPAGGAIENGGSALLDPRPGRKQRHRVEVALHGQARPKLRPGVVELGAPIHA